jgi:hypothetical protein
MLSNFSNATNHSARTVIPVLHILIQIPRTQPEKPTVLSIPQLAEKEQGGCFYLAALPTNDRQLWIPPHERLT